MSMVEFSPNVALDVTDRKAATEFYTETLGMFLADESGEESRLSCGETTFFVQEADEPCTYLEFSTADLASLVEGLEDSGCDLEQVETPEGETSYLVRDPYGLHFHVYEAATE